jgi:hypothetical protein
MKSLTMKTFALTLATLFVVPAAFAELKWGANVETNTTFENFSDGITENVYTNSGRVEVAVESETRNEGGYFVGGKGCFEIGDGGYASCDMWVRLGTDKAYLKVGHWEAENMFPAGEDVYVASAGTASFYKVGALRGRNPDGMGLLITPSEALTLDLKIAYDNDGEDNWLGARPVAIFKAGNLTVKAGAEYVLINPFDTDSDEEDTLFGGGVNVTLSAGNLTFAVNAAYGKEDVTVVDTTVDEVTGIETTTKTDADEKVMSNGGYITMKMGDNTLGLGGAYTKMDEADADEMYAFVSYAMPLPVENAFVKFGGSFSSGNDGSEDLTAFGARVRFNYTF